MLVHARLAVVADTVRERLLQRRPLRVAEGHRVVVAAKGLLLALEGVVGQRSAGADAGSAVRRNNLVALPGRDVHAVTVGAAVGDVTRLVLDDLLRQRNVPVVRVDTGEPPVLGED